MKTTCLGIWTKSAAIGIVLLSGVATAPAQGGPDDVRLITLNPAHFHAALIQGEMLPGVAKRVVIYAPLGPDLLDHLKRIEQFNTRGDRPTTWEVDVHGSPDSLERMVAERPGNVVVLAGRNRGRINLIDASLRAGLNVLADKPWIIQPGDLSALESALQMADRQGLVAYDIMTERYEITTIIQRELVNDPAIFGAIMTGSDEEPGVAMESVHHIMKSVAGVPNVRPAFFFDIREQGEGLADIGTHLVDLVEWTLFPSQSIDYRKDIRLLGARRWPTLVSASQFRRVTGISGFPDVLRPFVDGEDFEYHCNNQIRYTIRGIHVRLDVLWNYESLTGTDTHHAVYRGSNAVIEIRQGEKENYRPGLYVTPTRPEWRTALVRAVHSHIERLQATYPGIGAKDLGKELVITIPERYRVGHEAHFAQVLGQFLQYVRNPKLMPAWERPNMVAKYYVTTSGLALSEAARLKGPSPRN
jgi:predicted dehydrogenase